MTNPFAPNTLYCGDAREVLARWPDECVDAVVTSPPYFRQRDYEGAANQVGAESSPDEYLARLTAIFQQVLRVLKPHGTCWIVIGDKYREGELLGLPWQLVLNMKRDGWRLRSDCIWQKPNAMPSSVKNRPTVDHEYIFFLTKTAEYHYNADAIREPHVTFSNNSRMKGGRRHFFQRGSTPEQGKNGGNANLHNGRWDQAFHPLGRNKRTVWSIPLSKFREAHFAVFPASLVRTCLLAGCKPGGVVLDPFLGSGTSAVVARELELSYVGIDCVPNYVEMARRRLADGSATSALPLFDEARTPRD